MSSKIFLAAVIFCVFLAARFPAFAQGTASAGSPPVTEKTADIMKLMQVTGSSQLGEQVVAQVIAEFKKLSPTVPQTFWDNMSKEANPDDLNTMTISIYDKYLSDDDIKGLIEFYQSPLGQKMIQVMPKISRESMTAARAWGIQFVEKVESDLKAQGYGTGQGNGTQPSNSTQSTTTKQ